MATNKEKQKRGQKQLKTKLKLERKLDRKMRRFFNQQNRRFLDLQSLGLVLDAELMRPELYDILYDHYQDSTRAFTPDVLTQVNDALEDAGEQTIPRNHPDIVGAFILFWTTNAIASSIQITNTSNKEIDKALVDSEGDSKKAYKKLQSRNIPRSATIAATETQKGAEGSKQIISEQANEIVAAGTAGAILLNTVKTWVTRMDTKVRSDHVFAEFQTVPLKDPYLVGGEFLMYPGDTSLGASAWNVVNCRCNSIHDTKIL